MSVDRKYDTGKYTQFFIRQDENDKARNVAFLHMFKTEYFHIQFLPVIITCLQFLGCCCEAAN